MTEALFDQTFQVLPHLFTEFLLDSLAMKKRSEAKTNLCEPARHLRSLQAVNALLTTREMAFDNRSHCCASFARAFRPARVRA